MEGVKRTNTVVVRNPLQAQERRGGGIRRDPYIIYMDKGRNCYSCGGFGHLAWNCRRQGIVGQGRRIGYKNNQNTMNNLNGEENLIVLN